MEEKDPAGKPANTPGAKLDYGKPRLDLVLGEFAEALMQVGNVGTFGAAKYTDNGWQSVENGHERYLGAALRHYFKYRTGQHLDSDSKLHHLSHMAWNILAAYELLAEENKLELPN